MKNDDNFVLDAIDIAEKTGDVGSTVDSVMDAVGLLTPSGNGMSRKELADMLARLKRDNRVRAVFRDGKTLYSRA